MRGPALLMRCLASAGGEGCLRGLQVIYELGDRPCSGTSHVIEPYTVSPQSSTAYLLYLFSAFFIWTQFFFQSVLLENYSGIWIIFLPSLENTEIKAFKPGQHLSREHSLKIEHRYAEFIKKILDQN